MVLLHLPPTLGVALVASESVHNHMREASIRGPHLSHSTSYDESVGSQNGRPHFCIVSRVVHGYGYSRGIMFMGVTGLGAVLDFSALQQITNPYLRFAGIPWVHH